MTTAILEICDYDRNETSNIGRFFRNYFNTISEAIEAAKEYAINRGYTIEYKATDMIVWYPMNNGMAQTKIYTLYKNGVQSKKALNISLYKMESGKYELTTYIS